jgi:hypothetical protein
MPEKLPKTITFKAGTYGWEIDEVFDTASYLYTALLNESTQLETDLAHIASVLEKHGIEYYFKPLNMCFSTYSKKLKVSSDVWIDHSTQLSDFLRDIMSDDDRLLRFLCAPDSKILTGNDNVDETDVTIFRDVPKEDTHEIYFKGN